MTELVSVSDDTRCWRCFHQLADLGARGICAKEILPMTGPRICECPLFVIGPPEKGACRSCGAGIVWWRTRYNKPVPCDPDGVNHFVTCPTRDQHRKRAASSAGSSTTDSAIPGRDRALTHVVDAPAVHAVTHAPPLRREDPPPASECPRGFPPPRRTRADLASDPAAVPALSALSSSTTPPVRGADDDSAVRAGHSERSKIAGGTRLEDKMSIKNGIVIRRAGDAHPQGREEVVPFEYKEGQPIATFYGEVLEQLFLWAQEQGIELQTLAAESPVLRKLVQLTGGKVTAGSARE